MNSAEQHIFDELKLASERAVFWKLHEQELTPIVEHVDCLEGRVTCGTQTIDINLTGSTGLLVGFVAFLEERGYRLDREVPEESFQSFWAWASHDFMPRIWLYFTNEYCERIQVGEEMVPRPIYEVRCSETPF